MGIMMEKSQIFEISRANIEWLKKNYKTLKKEYNNRWVIIENRKVVKVASTFEELMEALRKLDINKILVEYIPSEQVAMFF
jgi:hypothetical protein